MYAIGNMNYFVRESHSVEDLSWQDYNHLLELNIQFAKNHAIKPRLPETYGNIVCIGTYLNYIAIYGYLPGGTGTISDLDIIKNADCVIDEKGRVIKNRWGDQDPVYD